MFGPGEREDVRQSKTWSGRECDGERERERGRERSRERERERVRKGGREREQRPRAGNVTFSFSSVLLSSLELSYTKVYEP